MADGTTVVHITHEAARKIGGIGAVLKGLFTCERYLKAVGRSIVIGPLFSTEGSVLDRLGADGEVLYSSVDGFVNMGYTSAFRKIENFYNVGIIYGRRTFIDRQTGVKSRPEVLLIDVGRADKHPVDKLKKQMFERFGVRSDLYEHLWEYEQYVRLAPPAIAALKAIGAAGDSTVIISHEFMGMPTALAAILEPCCDFGTVFYAHEVATMRRIVENHPGHDTMFYNVLRQANKENLYVNDVFGDQDSYFKHPLVEAAKHCDCICAVGDHIAAEMRFLSPEFKTADIDIVYNGVPAYQSSVVEKLQSKEKLQRYCESLLGYKPELIFTHVTRLVASKGLWRDLRVLEHMEKLLRACSRTAVFFLLSTEVSQRRSCDIEYMESSYNWPVAHREGWPDLSGGEAQFYTAVQEFNSRSQNIKVIFVNQFGFSRRTCGTRMGEDMEFMDIRMGSDVEFGQSIYEPFGISQLEPLTFGGICVLSSVCGCEGFLHAANGQGIGKNVIIADYTNLSSISSADIKNLLEIDRSARNRIEEEVSKEVAERIMQYLPKNESEIESMIQNGYSLAKKMSWDVVVKKYVLPSLQTALHKQPSEFAVG